MGLAKLKTKVSAKDYLKNELVSPVKHEFVGGEVYAMAGGSVRHNVICGNIFAALRSHLIDNECDVIITDVKIKTTDDAYYYPDVFVSCDKTPKSHYYREEPVLIVEVASPSTRQIDRREKLRAYQQIPSVQEYVIVEQDKFHIELHRRQPNGNWITYFYNDNDMDVDIEFQSVGLNTNLDEIYRRVNFREQPDKVEESDN